jgi:hypothetical protein
MAKPADAPPSKRDGLVVQSIDGELIVYDPETHNAHSLNRPAAAVFGCIDGKTPVSAIARKLGAAASERSVRVALERLSEAGLLKAPVAAGRRAIVRGLAVAAVPVVTSIVVPKANAAASCGGASARCTLTPCCPSHRCTTPLFYCV